MITVMLGEVQQSRYVFVLFCLLFLLTMLAASENYVTSNGRIIERVGLIEIQYPRHLPGT
jgi:hypothetical protein